MVTNNAWNSQDPAQVALGGTGAATLTGVLLGSGTSSITGLTGNSAVIASNSSGTFAARAFSIVEQVFTSSGTYTPTTGMLYCIVRMVGGGGGSGGTATTGATQYACSSGGGAGEYAEGVFSASTIGVSQTVTVGSSGAAGVSGNNAGGTGGTTSVGSLITAIGGSGGAGGPGSTSALTVFGTAGGTGGTGGSFRVQGGSSAYGLTGELIAIVPCNGGSSLLSGSALPVLVGIAAPGSNYGGGASSATAIMNTASQPGGAGAQGIVIITEYVIA